jgi:hypothetical protein
MKVSNFTPPAGFGVLVLTGLPVIRPWPVLGMARSLSELVDRLVLRHPFIQQAVALKPPQGQGPGLLTGQALFDDRRRQQGQR